MRLLFRLTLLFPLILLILLPAKAAAQSQEQPPEEVVLDCRECHWDVYLGWEQSAHGKGLSCGQCHLADEEDHARQGHGAQGGAQACMSCHTTGYNPADDTWEEDNIHCTACHAPIEPDHPDKSMPTNRSDKLCGRCHIQAHFEWQASSHGRAEVACVSCHSQHTTSLKSNTISEQCANCHEDYVEGFTHSVHYEHGLSCANCHLAPLEGPLGEGSAKRSHSFEVVVTTCVSCHKEGLHNAAHDSGPDAPLTFQSGATDSTDALASSTTVQVSAEPDPASPMGFVTLGGIVLGLGIGGVVVGLALVLIPWINHWNRRKRLQAR